MKSTSPFLNVHKPTEINGPVIEIWCITTLYLTEGEVSSLTSRLNCCGCVNIEQEIEINDLLDVFLSSVSIDQSIIYNKYLKEIFPEICRLRLYKLPIFSICINSYTKQYFNFSKLVT